jgi:NAD(P)-dependent dehydrogenase (short-subunit alcohol dehydrogenase family)
MVDLSGRVAIVTGASAGLGRRFATVLAGAGAKVVLVARRADALEALAAQIVAAGGEALVHPLDLTDAAAVPALFDAAERRFGTVDILVNNAGIPDANHATRLDLETVDRVIAVNLRAPFLLSTECARRLIAASLPGRIVNISSVGVLYYTPQSGAALYCATKAAIVRLTETLALEWARYGINVNAIAPGMFKSEMTAGFIERVGEKVRSHFPRQRLGEPEYLDTTLLYLVDPASHFVTGASITVDDAQTSR